MRKLSVNAVKVEYRHIDLLRFEIRAVTATPSAALNMYLVFNASCG